MRFLLDDEQRGFGRSLDAMLTAAGAPSVLRAWAAGDHAPGRALWGRLADAGVFALAVPEAYGGLGPLPVELAVACVELGRHAVPGPVAETLAAGVLLGGAGGPAAEEWLPRIASGGAVVSLRLAGHGPYALDADAADAVFTVDGDELRLAPGPGEPSASADPARRLFRPEPGGEVAAAGPGVREAARAAGDLAAFATAARTALQSHGAVGYTEELDLAWWLRRARPLRDAWGTPSACRARVLAD